ncbi:lysylphosphatidylglycerol synthase transmembrane domain-containing protein [Actinoplanes sp. NPDC051411]|uniref:lysylphosphatidylglycerol synthase transmembrane domain-containing protein n=1 Tax=Actinoplanes sp. NPDC051411 TaxID=3155522 RepID=UPI003428C44F
MPSKRTWSRLRLPAVLLAATGLAAFGLWGRLPDPRSFLSAFTGADYSWIALAVILQVVSLGAFAWQQRLLMGALGVRLKARHAALVTLARTALSISMPAGGAVSAAYAVREYERAGTPREVGTASMIVSGLASIGGLALLYVGGFAALVTTDPHLLAGPRPLIIIAVLAALTFGAVLAGRRWMRRPPPPADAGPETGLHGFLRRTLASAREGWRAGASLRARDWIVAVLLLGINWLTDLLCLAATCRAVGLPVGVTTLAGIYLGVQIVRQVPLTPGGVGVIDTALIAGLTAAGATAATAVAAVLVYRLISCWLLLPLGGVAAVLLRRRRPEAVSRRRAKRRAAA